MPRHDPDWYALNRELKRERARREVAEREARLLEEQLDAAEVRIQEQDTELCEMRLRLYEWRERLMMATAN